MESLDLLVNRDGGLFRLSLNRGQPARAVKTGAACRREVAFHGFGLKKSQTVYTSVLARDWVLRASYGALGNCPTADRELPISPVNALPVDQTFLRQDGSIPRFAEPAKW